EIASTNNRPPIVEKYFNWPPIRDPAKNSQTFIEETAKRMRCHSCCDRLARDDTQGKHRKSNRQRSASNPKQFLEFARAGSGAIVEVPSESRIELTGLRSGCLCVWQMHDDSKGLVRRQLSRPTDDEFLC